MKIQLEENALYCMMDEKFVYRVDSFEAYNGYSELTLNLKLVMVWDYIHPDYNVKGWCPIDNYDECFRLVTEIMCFLDEGMKEALEAVGYRVFGKYKDLEKSLNEFVKSQVTD